jgi:hypothetical protein
MKWELTNFEIAVQKQWTKAGFKISDETARDASEIGEYTWRKEIDTVANIIIDDF